MKRQSVVGIVPGVRRRVRASPGIALLVVAVTMMLLGGSRVLPLESGVATSQLLLNVFLEVGIPFLVVLGVLYLRWTKLPKETWWYVVFGYVAGFGFLTVLLLWSLIPDIRAGEPIWTSLDSMLMLGNLGGILGFVGGVSSARSVYNQQLVDTLEERNAEIEAFAGQLSGLHEATRKMFEASEKEAVCDIAVQAFDDTFESSITGIWLHPGTDDYLEPVAASDDAETHWGRLERYDPGDSRVWDVYRTGEIQVPGESPDGSDDPGGVPSSHGVLLVPIPDYGVMKVGVLGPESVGDNDVELVKLMAASIRVALERIEDENRLERQTDRMEVFNSILRHDILNAVTVIRSRGEFLAEDLTGGDSEHAETIVQWSDNIQDVVGRVRAVLDTLTGESETSLEVVDLAPILRNELDRVQSTYPAVTFESTIPDSVSVVANELVSEVVANVITNAVEHNDAEDLAVSVTVEADDEYVTTRIADTGTGVHDKHKAAIFRRGESGMGGSTGSGFGLFFVDAMVGEYGGEVWVEDNDDGGATFVIQLETPDESAATP